MAASPLESPPSRFAFCCSLDHGLQAANTRRLSVSMRKITRSTTLDWVVTGPILYPLFRLSNMRTMYICPILSRHRSTLGGTGCVTSLVRSCVCPRPTRSRGDCNSRLLSQFSIPRTQATLLPRLLSKIRPLVDMRSPSGPVDIILSFSRSYSRFYNHASRDLDNSTRFLLVTWIP